MKKFKFIDLFSGIGAFHIAMKNLGGECVFASEIDEECVQTYKENFNIDSKHDITNVDERSIPKHDVLCAGFPCQAFSKAGKRLGINDTRGTLFFDIARILKYHHTKYIVLENVRNLVSHDNGRTWNIIKNILHDLGYRLTKEPLILSPYNFGVPQIRDRIFILGVYDPENVNIPIEIKLDNLKTKDENSIYSIIDREENNFSINEYEKNVLEIWDDFIRNFNKEKLGFPIWIDSFDRKSLPTMPFWKQEIMKKNNLLYKEHKSFIDSWLKKNNYLSNFKKTHRKFEWQAGTSIESLYEGVIQFRPSGIRVKRPDTFPALVAIIQTPIIGSFKRRLSPRECARLQSFPENFKINKINKVAYKQFGNSANVKVIQSISRILFDNY